MNIFNKEIHQKVKIISKRLEFLGLGTFKENYERILKELAEKKLQGELTG
jgi:hypothetical protein